MYYVGIEGNIGVKMRSLLGINLSAKWLIVGAQIRAAVVCYLDYCAAEEARPRRAEHRAALLKGLSNVEGVLDLLHTHDEIPFEFRGKANRGNAKRERLVEQLSELRYALQESMGYLRDLRGRPRTFATKQLAFHAALLLFLLRAEQKIPKHSEHHAFARLMLQDAGIKAPGPGLADVCKDMLVQMKRTGVFGEKKSQIKRLLPPPLS